MRGTTLDHHEEGLARLASDVASGAWRARYGHLLDAEALDLGYRIVVAHLSRGG